MELVVSAIVLGVLVTSAVIHYGGVRQQGLDREAAVYLQLLRQSALYYYNQFGSFPTNIGQVPQARVPFKRNRTSSWAYCYASQNSANWSDPGALLKPAGRSWVIRQDGEILTGRLDPTHLSDEP